MAESPRIPTKEESENSQKTEKLLREIAVRESYYLLEELFDSLDYQNKLMLHRAADHGELLYAQAHSRVIDDLRRRFQKYRPQTQRDVPFVVSSQPPSK